MILKKPYAFLIKHFKLIHLILTGLYIYLLIKVNSLLNYFNGYISGTENRLNAIKLVTNYYVIAIILSIIICLIIFALMRYKKKPKLLYFILIILYILIAIIINYTYKGLNEIYIYNTLEAKMVRLYRDILRITTIFQYISIAFTLIRGLGFDIKKFNFKEDIADLGLDIDDDEEIELTLGSNEGILRKVRKKIREYIYYYKENKLYLVVLASIITIIALSSITIDQKIINKTYNQNENVETDAYTFNVTNTYLTNISYNNKIVSGTNDSYVIVKINIYPHTKGSIINTGNILLQIGKNKYTPELKNTNNFKDLGTLYTNQKILNAKSYIFIFNILKKDINNKMLLTYADKQKIKLSPKDIDTSEQDKEYNINDTLDLSNTVLERGYITINSIDIKNNFTYDFTYEVNKKTYNSKQFIKSTTNTIMNIKLTSDLPNSISLSELLNNYTKIKYKINEEEYITPIISNKTPGNYKEGLYLEVDKQIENATHIWLEITIRNKKNIYHLK